MIIANAVFYNGTEAEKVYLGNDLVWEKTSTPNPAHQIMGKFTDDSTEENWKCKINGNEVVLPVDPTTKEFSYNVEGEVTSFSLGNYANYYERIDCLNLYIPEAKIMPRTFADARNLKYLDVSKLNIPNVTNIEGMFVTMWGCETLIVNGLTTSNVTNMKETFRNSTKLKNLDVSQLDVSKVTNMKNCFASCQALATLNLSGWDIENVISGESFIGWNGRLTTVLGPITGVGANWTNTTNLDLHYSPLTNASAMVFINGLAEVTEAKSITFKASTFDTLTDEQIAVATSKGWNVVRSA